MTRNGLYYGDLSNMEQKAPAESALGMSNDKQHHVIASRMNEITTVADSFAMDSGRSIFLQIYFSFIVLILNLI